MYDFRKLMKETGWSEEICRSIGSEEEAKIYVDAGLREQIVNGRCALVNPAICGEAFYCRAKWLQDGCGNLSNPRDWWDWNNADLMGEGFPPRDENGDVFELHHIGQRQDSPFAELTYWQHISDGNNKVLHPKRESEINRGEFEKEKSAHWMARFKDFKNCYSVKNPPSNENHT